MYPRVETFWNWWPFPLLVWTPIRVVLNIFFFPLYFLFWYLQFIWNFIPEVIPLWLFTILNNAFNFIAFWLGLVWFPFTVTFLFLKDVFLYFIAFNITTLWSQYVVYGSYFALATVNVLGIYCSIEGCK